MRVSGAPDPALSETRGRHRRSLGLAALGAVLIAARLAQAAPTIVAPPECGSQAEFEGELSQRLGRGAPAVLPATVVHIDREADAYHLSMWVGREQRDLRDADCRALFRAAIVIAVALTEPLAPPAERPLNPPAMAAPAPPPPIS